jgi:hypothetical protein
VDCALRTEQCTQHAVPLIKAILVILIHRVVIITLGLSLGLKNDSPADGKGMVMRSIHLMASESNTTKDRRDREGLAVWQMK